MSKKHTIDKSALLVGLWQYEQKIDVVWFAEEKNLLEKQPHFITLPRDELANLPHLMQQKMATNKGRYQFVGSIQPHQVWSQTLLLPQKLNAQECEQQCRFTLERELPIPLTEVWHDYSARNLKQGFRLDIFALKKSLARDYVDSFKPLKLGVLDNAGKTLLRAVSYVLDKKIDGQSLLLYQDEQRVLAVCESAQQTYMLSLNTSQNLTALHEQFCQRYQIEPAQVYYYSTMTQTQLPTGWNKIETDFPLMALGNALWGKMPTWQNAAQNDRTFEASHGK